MGSVVEIGASVGTRLAHGPIDPQAKSLNNLGSSHRMVNWSDSRRSLASESSHACAAVVKNMEDRLC